MYFRRSFFLSNPDVHEVGPKASRTFNDHIEEFPNIFYKNKTRIVGYQYNFTLSSIITDNAYREKLFKGKIITLINVHLADNKKKAAIEIDFCERVVINVLHFKKLSNI